MATTDLWPLIITAVLSVAGTLAITYFGHRLGLSKDKELRQEELDRHARFLAIRVVCSLDPFVSECCDVASDDGAPGLDGTMEAQVSSPTISFPEDVDWKSVKPDLMYRILGLPNEIDIARQSVAFVSDHIAGPPDYDEFFQERTIQYGRLGLAALALADEMRQAYGIPKRNYGTWHPKASLEQSIAKVEKERQEMAAAHANFAKTIVEGVPVTTP